MELKAAQGPPPAPTPAPVAPAAAPAAAPGVLPGMVPGLAGLPGMIPGLGMVLPGMSPEQMKQQRTVHVAPLADELSEEECKTVFQAFGPVSTSRVDTDANGDRFALLEFADKIHADAALHFS